MKKTLVVAGLLGLLSTTSILGWTHQANANNSNVEYALQSYGDLSMFYQALLNTGVINELREGEHYTIFAPTNSAFAEIRPQTYPCFYATECRPQIAVMLRDHILEDNHPLADLTSYGYGIRTIGDRRIHVQQDYVNDYSIEGHKILSRTEVGGNVIYRINGVITTPQELAQFRQGVAYVPATYVPDDNNVVTEKTVTRKTYRRAPLPDSYPSGDVDAPANDSSQTTIITHTYTTE